MQTLSLSLTQSKNITPSTLRVVALIWSVVQIADSGMSKTSSIKTQAVGLIKYIEL